MLLDLRPLLDALATGKVALEEGSGWMALLARWAEDDHRPRWRPAPAPVLVDTATLSNEDEEELVMLVAIAMSR